MRFVAPANPSVPNSLQASDVSLIVVAGAVGQMTDDSGRPRTASDQVTIADRGIRSGWSVKMINVGGQWSTYYTDPVLDVQAVDSTVAAVQARMHTLIGAVMANLALLQKNAGVSPPNMINARLLTEQTPQIYYQAGSRTRALASALIIGVGLTLATIWIVASVARSRLTD